MEDKGPGIVALASVFLVLTTLTMALRLYVRAHLTRSMGIDDYVMVVCFVSNLAYLTCQLIGTSYGIGRHIWDLEQDRAETALMYWWLCEVFYAPATSLLKVSVGLFLLRITTPVHRYQIFVIRAFIAGSIVCGTVYLLLIIFQCHPISFWWDLNNEHHGTCIDATSFTICSWIISVLNSAADFAFAAIPVLLILQTTMSKRNRIYVCILLSVASVAGIVTIVRMPFIYTVDHYKGDFLWTTIQVAALSSVECGIGITAANLATCRPLIKRYQQSKKDNTYEKQARNNPSLVAPDAPDATMDIKVEFCQTIDIQEVHA